MTIPIEARLEIQQLVADYAFLCDTKQYSDIGALFADDGVWDETVIGAPLAQGPDAVNAAISGMGAMVEAMIHLNTSHRITERDGQTAAGTVHLLCEATFQGAPVRIRGYYDDRYLKQAGRWTFQRRKLVEIFPTTGLTAPETSEVSS